jgi:PAS domain-containing protein
MPTLLGIRAASSVWLRVVALWQRVTARLARPAPSLVEHAQLLDLAYNAILVWELKTGAISFWNRGSEELYGWEKKRSARTHSPGNPAGRGRRGRERRHLDRSGAYGL